VLVVDGGTLVEDGSPAALLARPSKYREMAEAEDRIRTVLWTEESFRRLRLEGGSLREGTS
jgi:hypothetical protein